MATDRPRPVADLDALEAALAAATPGPWHFSDPWTDGCVRHATGGTEPADFFGADDPELTDVFHTPARRIFDAVWHNDSTAGLYGRPEDAHLIALARNALPDLIALARGATPTADGTGEAWQRAETAAGADGRIVCQRRINEFTDPDTGFTERAGRGNRGVYEAYAQNVRQQKALGFAYGDTPAEALNQLADVLARHALLATGAGEP